MNIEFQRIGKIFDPKEFSTDAGYLSHAANPVVLKINESIYRIFFNSRDLDQRSSVYSVDFNFESKTLVPDSFREQLLLSNSFHYFRDGVSLGSHFELDGKHWIGFMGWVNPPSEHWFGTIGKFRLDSDYNFEYIEPNPWFDLSPIDPISLSYPAVYFSKDVMHVWYGTTMAWDGGNGEMVHILKEKVSRDYINFVNSERQVEWKTGQSQAFSRPSITPLKDKFLMAYSVRGNLTKYRIGVGVIEEEAKCITQIATFSTSLSNWENEMVEYPYLVSYEDETYMFYNGNGYGKSGIGLAKIIIE